jgi:hypothetical protein
MRLRYTVWLIILIMWGCAAKVPATTNTAELNKNKDWSITVTWNYDFTNYVLCSATVTKGCISGFTWGYIQGGVSIPIKTSAPSVCTGTTQPEICGDSGNALLGIGPATPYVVANYIDNNGNTLSSSQALGALDTVPAGNPTSVTWNRK